MIENQIRTFFKKHANLIEGEDLNLLVSHSYIDEYEKNEVIQPKGKGKNYYFLMSGAICGSYYKTEDRIVVDFYCNHAGAMDPNLHVHHSDYHMIITCFKKTKILVTSRAVFDAVLKHNACLKEYVRANTNNLYNYYQEREYMRSLLPYPRVKYCSEKFPIMTASLNQSLVASFLDMSRSEYNKYYRQYKKEIQMPCDE